MAGMIRWLAAVGMALVVGMVAAAQEGTPEAGELTERVSNDAGTMTMLVPEGWEQRSTDTAIYIATNEDALYQYIGDEFAPGEVTISAEPITIGELSAELGIEVTREDSPLKILQGLLKVATTEMDVTFGTLERVTVNDRRAATVTVANAYSEGRLWIIEARRGVLVGVAVVTAPGELAEWEATGQAVAESVEYVGEE